MPTVTIPSPAFATGVAVDATAFKTYLSDRPNPENSLSAINGVIDDVNVSSAFMVQAEHTQRGSHARVLSASGTLNLDYFRDVFEVGGGEFFTPDLSTDTGLNIPGAGRRWYQPWDGSDALFFWTIHWSSNANPDNERATIYLELDGTFVGTTKREVLEVEGTVTPHNHEGYARARVYSGHWYARGMAEGWHEVSMILDNVQSASVPKQTRVWARHMIVVPLRGLSG